MRIVHDVIRQQIRRMMGPPLDLETPPGDPGLFGPASVCWRVHGDFTTMMIGGVSALLLQMLHPGALAGVWDHSDFRHDMLGRLRGTARFVSGTTYGSVAQAETLIGRVRSIHDHVHGHLPDGMTYSANDPDLLTWVHVAEVTSFLQAYLRYRDPDLSRADQDRYFAETASVAERLGAADVPITRLEVENYLVRVRPALRFDERTREVASVLLSQRAPSLLLGPFRNAVMDAGIDLLPIWAADMHGLRLSAPRRHLARVGAQGIGAMMRQALREGPAVRAKRRMAA